MKTIFSEKHLLRDAKTELFGGQLVAPFERPSRAVYIRDRLLETSFGPIVSPQDYGMEPILRIHDRDFVDFLQRAWHLWAAEGFEGEAIATTWSARRMSSKKPNNIDGLLGYYALAAETSITETTWEAAYASAQVAATGAHEVLKGNSVFALCRPPGHHAARDLYGGYCFLNNAAIATQILRDKGMARVAIVDVDFHHGNGTQDIFYHRNDVLFASLHGDPYEAFPFFLGHPDEVGEGQGIGFNHNYAMPEGTEFKVWRSALQDALDRVRAFQPDALVVSLGVDTFETDPISFFKLKSPDFTTYGQDLGRLNLPTLFMMEGGYDVEEIGLNTVNVLSGFEAIKSP